MGDEHKVTDKYKVSYFYFHMSLARAKNRLRDKTGFEIFNPQNVEKSGFGQSLCVSVCFVCFLSRNDFDFV